MGSLTFRPEQSPRSQQHFFLIVLLIADLNSSHSLKGMGKGGGHLFLTLQHTNHMILGKPHSNTRPQLLLLQNKGNVSKTWPVHLTRLAGDSFVLSLIQ